MVSTKITIKIKVGALLIAPISNLIIYLLTLIKIIWKYLVRLLSDVIMTNWSVKK